MSRKILVATEKPFAVEAVDKIAKIFVDAGSEISFLEKYTDKKELLNAVKDVDALIIRSDKIDKEVLTAAKNLKIVVRAGAGFDNVDTAFAKEKGVVVMNTPGQNSNAVAELVLGMMVFMARGMFNGKPGTELKGKSLGIHAYGNVGSNVARIAKGFGMNVYAFDPFVSADVIKKDGVIPVESVEKLYETCHYISLHIPANKHTINSINYSLLSLMPLDGALINTARKEVINEDDLIKLMDERSGFKYIADIEPCKKLVFLEKFDGRFFFTPKKMGAQTKEANINAGVAAATQIVGFFDSGDVTFQVNK